MNPLERWLESGKTILLDGAMGTMLIEAGLEPGDPPELWNMEHPDKIRAIHRGYIDAGSQVILTNSFGGHPLRLAMHGMAERAFELNKVAAELARAEADSAARTVVVAGSMGPTGALLEPLGTVSAEEMQAGFATQAEALAAGGADVLWVETMSDLSEVRSAVDGARSACDLPVVSTMSFDTNGHTMMGTSPVQAVEALAEMDLLAVGANCGNGPEEIEAAIKLMHEHAPGVRLVAKANAGVPKIVDGEAVYLGTPAVMASYAKAAREAGATLIGGCCGNGPAHVRAMAEALGIQTGSSES
jgi:methionine synthase I (cobalamin-dependent)